MNRLEQFLQGYIECALWLELTPDGEAYLQDVGAELTAEAREAMKQDCAKFIEENAADLDEANELGRPDDYLGHDFWLTRNHHGAGFWDRGDEEVWERLTEASHKYGEASLYLDSDGTISHEAP